MKRIGLIDNMQDLPAFVANQYERATAAEVMDATGGNTGNVAYVHGVRKLLGDRVQRIGWDASPELVNRDVDHIVVCCANQLGEHVDLGGWAERLATFDKPVTLIGLGAQAPDTSSFPKIPEGTLRFLELVSERRQGAAPNIAVRGEFTRSFLDTLGIVAAPIGCPSLQISAERALGRRILHRQEHGRVERVAVAAGNPWHGPSAPLERVLVKIVEEWSGEYVLQHPVSMLQYAYGELDRIKDQTKTRFMQVYGERFDEAALAAWYQRYAVVFVDAPNWMRFLGRFDLVLGPRYHGVALGLQAGVPGCVLTIDSRTEELCKGTGIKSLPVEEVMALDAEELVATSKWCEADACLLDVTRQQQSLSYMDFIVDNALTPSKHLELLAA